MKRTHNLLIKLLSAIFSVMFVVGVFYLLDKNIEQPLTEADIEECTLIASDIYYNQKDVLIYDVPENYTVEFDDTTITVIPTDDRYGCVECRMQNGKLVSNYVDQTVFHYILCGGLTILAYVALLVFALIACYIFLKVCDFIAKKQKSKSEESLT